MTTSLRWWAGSHVRDSMLAIALIVKLCDPCRSLFYDAIHSAARRPRSTVALSLNTCQSSVSWAGNIRLVEQALLVFTRRTNPMYAYINAALLEVAWTTCRQAHRSSLRFADLTSRVMMTEQSRQRRNGEAERGSRVSIETETYGFNTQSQS